MTTSLLDAIASQPLGIACMALFILGLHFEWWVMGGHYRSTAKDKDEYKALNRSSEATAQKVLELLEKVSGRLEHPS